MENVLNCQEAGSVYIDLSVMELCRPGWPQTHRNQPTSASCVLGLKGCAPMPATCSLEIPLHCLYLWFCSEFTVPLGGLRTVVPMGRVHCSLESASEARSLVFHACPSGCLWWPYKGKIPFRQSHTAQKKQTYWRGVSFLTSLSKRKPPGLAITITQPFLELVWPEVFLCDWKRSKVISENLSVT